MAGIVYDPERPDRSDLDLENRELRVAVHPHKFRHHFSHSRLDRGGNGSDLMELNGLSAPQMLQRYGARARRTYDRIMIDE